jgi:hypothetical protein
MSAGVISLYEQTRNKDCYLDPERHGRDLSPGRWGSRCVTWKFAYRDRLDSGREHPSIDTLARNRVSNFNHSLIDTCRLLHGLG